MCTVVVVVVVPVGKGWAASDKEREGERVGTGYYWSDGQPQQLVNIGKDEPRKRAL